MRKTFLTVLCVLLPLSGPALGDEDNWTGVAEKIERVLMGALRSYEGGKSTEAMEEVADAYFVVFEGENANMEIAVRRFLSVKKSRSLERAFTDIRRDMHEKTAFQEVRKKVSVLIDDLKKAADELDRKGVGLDVGYK